MSFKIADYRETPSSRDPEASPTPGSESSPERPISDDSLLQSSAESFRLDEYRMAPPAELRKAAGAESLGAQPVGSFFDSFTGIGPSSRPGGMGDYYSALSRGAVPPVIGAHGVSSRTEQGEQQPSQGPGLEDFMRQPDSVILQGVRQLAEEGSISGFSVRLGDHLTPRPWRELLAQAPALEANLEQRLPNIKRMNISAEEQFSILVEPVVRLLR